MGFVWSIIIGFFIGLVARALTPGRNSAGFIITALLGILGSVIANYIGVAMGAYAPNEPAGFLASVIGAMLVLFIYHMAFGRKTDLIGR
jgi:uncharacterized membrane protein YeaQ/YmgE (transglycosylase-associated protein family)